MIIKSSLCFLFALTVSAQDGNFGFAAVAGQKGGQDQTAAEGDKSYQLTGDGAPAESARTDGNQLGHLLLVSHGLIAGGGHHESHAHLVHGDEGGIGGEFRGAGVGILATPPRPCCAPHKGVIVEKHSLYKNTAG